MTTESHADTVARLRRLWPDMADRAERTRLAILEDARRGEDWSEEEEEEDNMKGHLLRALEEVVAAQNGALGRADLDVARRLTEIMRLLVDEIMWMS